MAVPVRFRDIFAKYSPPWLADRHLLGVGKSTGYRLLWSMISQLDELLEVLIQGKAAAFPGVGTITALPLIGRMRGILRGEAETDADYSARLRTWLELWRAAGSAEAIAHAISSYASNMPMVRIVTRSGYWVTWNPGDGLMHRAQQAWDWDSVSNPERAGYWSEIWIIVYPTEWATTGPFLDTAGTPTWGSDTLGIGHDATQVAHDAILGLVAQWKSAHTKVRTILWTSDATKYDPSVPASLPNGTWGMWGDANNTTRAPGGRDLTSTRYWEAP